MPETTTNGHTNGNRIHNGYEMEDNASFLFTSESVGEGHPGEFFPRIMICLASFDWNSCSPKPLSIQTKRASSPWLADKQLIARRNFIFPSSSFFVWKTCARVYVKRHDVVADKSNDDFQLLHMRHFFVEIISYRCVLWQSAKYLSIIGSVRWTVNARVKLWAALTSSLPADTYIYFSKIL